MRAEREGGAAAWLEGNMVAPSGQGHGLPPAGVMAQSESFLEPLVGDQRASLASLSP